MNCTLKECRYVNEEEGEDYWFGEFLNEKEALMEALREHPEYRYNKCDFDEFAEYRLKESAS